MSLFFGLMNFLDRTLHVEVLFWNVIVFPIQDLAETANGICGADIFAGFTRENLSHMEGLAQESLDRKSVV